MGKYGHEEYEEKIRDGLARVSYAFHFQNCLNNQDFFKDKPIDAQKTFWHLYQIILRDYIFGVYKLVDEPKRPDDANMEGFLKSIDEKSMFVKAATKERLKMNEAIRSNFLINKMSYFEKIKKIRGNKKFKKFRDKALGHTTFQKVSLDILGDGIASAHGQLTGIYTEYLKGWKNQHFPQEFSKIRADVHNALDHLYWKNGT